MPKPHILIVDDELFFRHYFRDVLSEGNLYDLETVETGQEAMDYLSQNTVDIILTDMVMPDIDGIDLVHRTRTLNPVPDIILATAKASVETAIEALKSGAHDYLIKPCNPEHLRHIVKSCVDQRRLLAENYELHHQIRLYHKGQHLASQIHLEALFQKSLTTLLDEVGYEKGFCYLSDSEGISHISVHGFDEQDVEGLTELVRAQVETSQKAVTLNLSRGTDIPVRMTDESLWVFPLHSEGSGHGAVVLSIPGDTKKTELAQDAAVTFLCEQIAIGFNNSCKLRDARQLVFTDDLTGLYNHRYLHIALEQEINRSERYGLEFSLAFIDLDLFKRVNDQHGHMIGSDVLRQVARLLRTCVREADMLFRYGGDEFTALLLETDTHGARVVAERIRAAIENYDFSTGKVATGRLTATVGHASYPVHATTKDAMIELADKAMYLGKEERNVSRSAQEIHPS